MAFLGKEASENMEVGMDCKKVLGTMDCRFQ